MALSTFDTHSFVKVSLSPISPVRRRLDTLPSPEPASDAPDAIVAPDYESRGLSRAESFSNCWRTQASFSSRIRTFFLTSLRAYSMSPGTLHTHKQSLIVALMSFLPVPSAAQWLIALAPFCNDTCFFACVKHGWHAFHTAL